MSNKRDSKPRTERVAPSFTQPFWYATFDTEMEWFNTEEDAREWLRKKMEAGDE